MAPLTEKQQEMRAKGIGASETPAILGLDRYRSAVDVYMKKLGLVEDVATHHTARGNYLEPALREWASDKIGVRFEKCDPMIHPEHPRMLATPDGVYREGGRIRVTLELKAPGPRMVHEWEEGDDGAPDRVVVQSAQQQCVTGADVGYIAAFLGDDLRVYRVERDRELEVVLAERINEFWTNHIEAQVPPPVDGSESARAWLTRRFPRSTAKMMPPTEKAAELIAELRAARDAAKAAETHQEIVEQRLKEMIGDAAGIDIPNLGKVTWKNNTDTMWTDWPSIARHLGCTKEHEIKFTKSKPGPRVFRTHFPKEK
jgi:putative phage-type endonuclease